MKKFVALVVLVAFVGSVAGLVVAEDTPHESKDMVIKGAFVKVQKVEEKTLVVVKVVREEKEREIKVLTNDKTAVTVDGAEGKAVTDLKEGMTLEITKPRQRDAAATKIVAKTPPAPDPQKQPNS